MTPNVHDDELLRRILLQTDQASETDVEDHLDDDTLALFVEGALEEPQRTLVIGHLADCDECRRIVACLLHDESVEEAQDFKSYPLVASENFTKTSSPLKSRPLAIISAATVLMATGFWFAIVANTGGKSQLARQTYRHAETLLASSDFDQTIQVIQAARRRGATSDQLLSLQSQAVRHLPGTLALGLAGRLTDFGYDVDGTVARGTSSQTGLSDARQLLESGRNNEVELLLNRGHLLLSAGDSLGAVSDFRRVIDQAPDNIWGHLGLGLAQFIAEDFSAAQGEFEHCLKLDPGNVSARINLAMTLQELDKTDEAVRMWQSLLGEKLTTRDRELVERAMAELRPHKN